MEKVAFTNFWNENSVQKSQNNIQKIVWKSIAQNLCHNG